MSGNFVYFVKPVGFDGPIKIGCSSNLNYRMELLQSQIPFDLEVIHSFCGTFNEEREIHARFTDIQVRGEWFKPTDKLLKFIGDLQRGVPLRKLLAPLPRLPTYRSVAALRGHETRRRNNAADAEALKERAA